tara:strand:+ start:336 stop:506 length:171 start_codon:yes stop_codon:yes gene_type:complete
MTNSDIIEEILIKSHSLGIQQEVMGYAETLLLDDPLLDRSDALTISLQEMKKHLIN